MLFTASLFRYSIVVLVCDFALLVSATLHYHVLPFCCSYADVLCSVDVDVCICICI